jgi:hypothetical protein
MDHDLGGNLYASSGQRLSTTARISSEMISTSTASDAERPYEDSIPLSVRYPTLLPCVHSIPSDPTGPLFFVVRRPLLRNGPFRGMARLLRWDESAPIS